MSERHFRNGYSSTDIPQLLIQEIPTLCCPQDHDMSFPTLADMLEQNFRNPLFPEEIPTIKDRADLINQNKGIIRSGQNIIHRPKRLDTHTGRKVIKSKIGQDCDIGILFRKAISVMNHRRGFSRTKHPNIQVNPPLIENLPAAIPKPKIKINGNPTDKLRQMQKALKSHHKPSHQKLRPPRVMPPTTNRTS